MTAQICVQILVVSGGGPPLIKLILYTGLIILVNLAPTLIITKTRTFG